MGALVRDQLTGKLRRPRLLLADDHTIVLEGITRLLQSEYDLLPPAGDGQLLVENAMRTNPDVIIADISMPILNGIEAVRQLRKKGSKAKVIFLSMHADIEWAAQALAVGASGYVIKQSAAEELSHAIQEALRNKTYITPRVVRDKESMSHVSKHGMMLTAREREVLQLVAEGRTINGIAAILKVAGRTVVFHKTNIMDKLNLRTTADLTQYAVRHGMISV
ncbi:MAG TPA: response regulator transcription factor [Terriglobia bacterium]|nr:response regulator transcription factor [Terriglobia bacterium]